MSAFWTTGLPLQGRVADAASAPERVITAEATLTATARDDLRVEPLVSEGDTVAQGAPLLRLRRAHGLVITAPMPGRIAHLDLGPGQRLERIELFHEPDAGRHRHEPPGDETDAAALRALLQTSGLWRSLRSRPFGHVPAPDERPAAIFVMALDTRPGAPSPATALAGDEAAFARGLRALGALASEAVFLCQEQGADLLPASEAVQGLRILESKAVHPWGLAGLQIHRNFPAAPGRPVWDVAAEDVTALGELLGTGYLRDTRLVSVTGSAMRTPVLVRCQPWADLRGLAQGHVRPGPHVILSGSALDGRKARWLRPGDRQAAVLTPEDHAPVDHWFLRALRGASRPLPLIPSAALDRALGGEIPAVPLLRALSAGDAEGLIRLGALSLLAEDLALADYVTRAEPRLSRMLDSLLERIEAEGIA
ncbi:hypothetical protein [Salipiger mucosus]|uniref:Uncharacterized protein n=1 Tax=Salipiger mucosus DSM 16094 TaxID=1123237 RepID=S9REX8_9RHOB|nr:hypothetical protein [Salipiger mucosus]EPX76670.1 hypothetical protein Salmuc_00502 [Salipiger mucosus DSM 16094]